MSNGQKVLKAYHFQTKILMVLLFIAQFVAESKLFAVPAAHLGVLKVGVITPLTGPQAEYGKDLLIGVKVALEKYQKSKIKLASKIKILYKDDRSTPKGAEDAFHALKKERVSIIIGSASPLNSSQLAELAEQFKIPLIIPASLKSGYGKDHSHTFFSNFSSKWQGYLLAQLSKSHLKKTRPAILFDPTDPTAHDIADSFEQAVKANQGPGVVHKGFLPQEINDTNFINALETTLKSNPDIILLPTHSLKLVALTMSVLKNKKENIPLLGLTSWHDPNLNILAEKEMTNHYYPIYYSSQLKQTKDQILFKQKFTSHINRQPSSLAVISYDSMVLAIETLEKTKSHTTAEILQVLRGLENINGLLGEIKMLGDHSLSKPAVIIEYIENSRQIHSVL
ncbi:MAG: hypothetical protein CMP11_06010 [Zetaproteobacteria bacterium]|nr:hypothetical protein [Pseudobdellovibrionaceae bacterium]|tara:strand:+ start:575 stop:1759 length:1185 start_codon:yes stop_codon:yes gene_type:complete